MDTITISTIVHAPRERAWKHFTSPESIKKWAYASPDWHAPFAENDVRIGGSFCTRMEAKDGSTGFDFTGTYTAVVENERIEYVMDDGRKVIVIFEDGDTGVVVTETFDPESENPLDMQRAGWQAILNNFALFTESVEA